MNITYTKYNASGNTFVIFHTNKKQDYSSIAVKLCTKESVDGLIVLVPHMVYDFEWLFYNNDGSTASMCGNGTRAVGHYAYVNKLAGTYMKFLTGAGEISCTVDGLVVETSMTKPVEMKEPFDEFNLTWWQVDTGVPHLVTMVDDLEQFNLKTCLAMRDKYNANVNFAKVIDDTLKVRTYERGVEDETGACGTGMIASFLRANNLNLIPNSIKVYPISGEELTISKIDNELLFKGSVVANETVEVEV